ncbi:hypothetical protein IWZ00DRAFT_295730 [Phyllosticta capitalensis]
MPMDLDEDFQAIRDGFYQAPLDPDPPGPLSIRPERSIFPDNKTAEPWESLYHIGYKDVLDEAFDSYLDRGSVLPRTKKRAHFMKAGRSMLAAMSEQTVVSIMDGTVAEYCRSKTTRPHLGKFAMDAESERQVQSRTRTYQPVFYASYLVNSQGLPPTQIDLGHIANYVEGYVKGTQPDFNQKIDSQLPGMPNWLDRSRGDRRYLMIDEEDEIEEALEFVEAVRGRIPSLPYSTERARGLCGFGVTNNATMCFHYHQCHQGGRSLMYLVEAICLYLFKDYKIRHEIVFKAFDPDHLWAGEILLNCIGKGFRDTGYGFGFLGRDMEFQESAMARVDESHWLMWEKRAIKQTPLLANLSARIGKLQEKRRFAERNPPDYLREDEAYVANCREESVLIGMLHGYKAKVEV